ncbi:MAG: Txe/YoeB family addiction module toxin [Alphaproteobacteria bacterium]|nr:Txe/YoeB family addiction module toxin [Alphaproteobacteria bacterium]
MKLVWSSEAWNSYLEWQDTDRETAIKNNVLIRDAMRNPFRGLGKPEPLRGDLTGWWSRRITLHHRLVYRVAGSGQERRLEVAACRQHY